MSAPDLATRDLDTRRRPTPGLDLLGSELSVLFRRWRTWAMLAAVALIPILLAVAVRVTASELDPGEGPRSSIGSPKTACSSASQPRSSPSRCFSR